MVSYNPFKPSTSPKIKSTKIRPAEKVEIVTYYYADEVTNVDPKDPKNFLLKKVPAVKEKIALDSYIQSFSKDVGVSNIIGRMQDNELADFINRSRLPAEGVIYDGDAFTNLTDIQARKIMEAGEKAWKSIPDELKGNMSREEFIKKFNADMFGDFLKKKVASVKKPSDEKKEG